MLTTHILIVALLCVLLIGASFFVFVLIRYLLAIFINLESLKTWRRRLVIGDVVLIIENDRAIMREIVYVHDGFAQVKNTDGNQSGHHITNIYPICRKNGMYTIFRNNG